MWPWEHAVVGYLAYSLFSHLYYRESPGGLEAFAVVFASVLPDIIDKPLAWEYGIFDTGYALGHSIFFAIPLAIVGGVIARSFGRAKAGLAFAIGYLIHLPSDVLYHYVTGSTVGWELMLWPVQSAPPSGHSHDFTSYFSQLFSGYQEELLSGDLSTYLWVQLGVAIFTALLWLYDGAPVLRESLVGLKRVLVSVVRTVSGRGNLREQP